MVAVNSSYIFFVAIQTLYAFRLWHSTRQGKKAVGLNESTGKGRLTPQSMQQQLTPVPCV